MTRRVFIDGQIAKAPLFPGTPGETGRREEVGTARWLCPLTPNPSPPSTGERGFNSLTLETLTLKTLPLKTLALFLTLALFYLPNSTEAQGIEWGTVKGKITWGGKDVPKQAPIAAVAIHADKMACLMNGNVVVDEKWVVNPKNKGLKWTFVWLTNDDPKNKAPLPIYPDLKKPKSDKVEMDQPLCAFAPHAVAMREGQTLVARNSATIAHNFKWTGYPGTPNAGNNVIIPPGNTFDIKGLVADRFPVKIECNIHPWMNGWVRIFDHPYYAVTDAEGAFEFMNAPAGKYRLVVWHGSGGWLGGAAGKTGQPITIKGGGTLDVGNLVYPPPAQ